MSELLGKNYNEKTTKSFEFVLNKVLKKKYEWFDHIIVNQLSFSKSQDYMGIEAELYADENWVGEQWREFYYSKPMPSGTDDDPIILGELIGGEISKQLQSVFKTVFVFVTSEKKPKYMSHSWITVKAVNMNETLNETIRKVLHEESEKKIPPSMIKFLERRYPTLAKPNKLIRGMRGRPANSGYGSAMHDFSIYTTFYMDDMNIIWFKEFDDRDSSEDSKWELNEDFEKMYDIFGEELFQSFIKEYFGLDITEQGNKKYNWLFR